MKKKIFVIVALLTIVGLVMASDWAKTVFNQKGFPKSSTRSDTSTAIDLNGTENVELQTSVYGTDSVKITTYVLGYTAGVWTVGSASTSLILDNTGVTSGTGGVWLLRGHGTNRIPGFEKIKLVNTLQNADNDSSSANYYNQVIIGY